MGAVVDASQRELLCSVRLYVEGKMDLVGVGEVE